MKIPAAADTLLFTGAYEKTLAEAAPKLAKKKGAEKVIDAIDRQVQRAGTNADVLRQLEYFEDQLDGLAKSTGQKRYAKYADETVKPLKKELVEKAKDELKAAAALRKEIKSQQGPEFEAREMLGKADPKSIQVLQGDDGKFYVEFDFRSAVLEDEKAAQQALGALQARFPTVEFSPYFRRGD